MSMIFHQIRTERGCQCYLIGCSETYAGILIDPETSQIEHYLGLISHEGLILHYILDTHTHADHFSASKQLAQRLGVPLIMHSASPAPFVDMRVDDGEIILVGNLKFTVMHTPGHTSDSMSIVMHTPGHTSDSMSIVMTDRVFTGDTLLIGGTGRTDLPSGDPAKLYHSLFNGLLKLAPQTRVYPAHIYSMRSHSTIGEELEHNPRLQQRELRGFIKQMQAVNIKMPDHLTESLRTNLTGCCTGAQMLSDAKSKICFISLQQINADLASASPQFILVDVREKDAFDKAHIQGAVHIARGLLEIKVNDLLPDPSRRIAVYSDTGTRAILATATLKLMGFTHAVALEQGIRAWIELGYTVASTANKDVLV